MFGRKKDHPRAKTPRKSTADQHRIGSNVPTDRKLRSGSRRFSCRASVSPPTWPLLRTIAGAGSEQHDQAGYRRPGKERYGCARQWLILDPAPERRHTLVCPICHILGDIAGHLPCLLQTFEGTFPDPGGQKGNAVAKLLQTLPHLVDGILRLGRATEDEIALGAGITFGATFSHRTSP